MPHILKFLAISALALLTACAANGPIYKPAATPTDNKALVYIYRPSISYMLHARSAYFYVDNRNIVDIDPSGYSYTYLEAGEHKIKQKWPIDLIGFKDVELPISAQPGKTYFYRFTVDGGDGCIYTYNTMCFSWKIEEVSEQSAMQEISSCHYQPAK
jgi:hypothetical protein